MNEGEFRAKLNELGTSYQLAIKRMNAVDSPGLKNQHRRAASAVIDEIQALEREYKVRGDSALGKALWEGTRAVEKVAWTKIQDGDITGADIRRGLAATFQVDTTPGGYAWLDEHLLIAPCLCFPCFPSLTGVPFLESPF